MSNGSSTTVLQNDRVKVTLWEFQPGQDTGWHRHQYDYVIVPLTAGRLRLEVPGGREEFSNLEVGVPYFREVGVEHNVINDTDHEFRFIEIELLDK